MYPLASGHPIWGDALYAPPETQQRSTRLCLHAYELGGADPGTGAWRAFSVPVPF